MNKHTYSLALLILDMLKSKVDEAIEKIEKIVQEEKNKTSKKV